jgi:LmbE family N-acetylglucosaminyl deacetylase
VLKRATILCALLGGALLARPLAAQVSQGPVEERGATALGDLMEGLGNSARVLVIGAHPDDEDTQLIAWLAKGRHVETAYLSLTRGDGGQNLIGNELGPLLGMIRTQELLAARRIDGGHQYFTRAYDFGFSKNAQETFTHWAHDSVLKDVVTVIRAFRPQVIISVWSGTPADGHGHHQASGILAREAFDAAADTVRFPASTTGDMPAWTPSKFYRDRAYRGTAGATLRFNVGEYSTVLGRSYAEIAGESRSQHLSQGMGQLQPRGARMDAVTLEASRVSQANGAPEAGLFQGMDTTWARFASLQLPAQARAALDSIPAARAAARDAERLTDTRAMVAPLARFVRLANQVSDGLGCTALPVGSPATRQHVCEGALGDLAASLLTAERTGTAALLDAAHVQIEATASRELIAERDSVPVTVRVYDQGAAPVTIQAASIAGDNPSPAAPITIAPDSSASLTLAYHAGTVPSEPWWLLRPRRGDMFDIADIPGTPAPFYDMVIGEDAVRSSGVRVTLGVDGNAIPVNVYPIVYRYADPASGEVRRPISVVPEISLLLEHELEYARANAPFDRTVRVYLYSAATSPRGVDVKLLLPNGLTADSAVRHVIIAPRSSADVYFRVRGTLPAGQHRLSAIAASNGRLFQTGFIPVEYPHIQPQRYYRAATEVIQAVPVTYASTMRVGYIQGVGDNVEPMLTQLGINVTHIAPSSLPRLDLSRFTTIVVGTRAFAANDTLMANVGKLLAFARAGGTLVEQYGQNEMMQPGVMPYPITLARPAARVTDENAPVHVLDPASPLLNTPNRISQADFANWVQERATYMPSTFDPAYHAILEMNDPGEPPNDAAILVARLGRGTFVYTTLSFFRQLPATNPGAARLFVNLLSATPAAAPRAKSSPLHP